MTSSALFLFLLSASAHAAESPFARLTLWLDGFGEAGYEREAVEAEKLFCAGRRLPDGLTPHPRALQAAKDFGFECTLRALGPRVNEKIEKEAGQSKTYDIGRCLLDRRVIEEQENYRFEGCIESHDGTPYLAGTETFYWRETAVKAKGLTGAHGRHGRWRYFAKNGTEVGSADYYQGKVLKKRGKTWEVESPAPRISMEDMKSRL